MAGRPFAFQERGKGAVVEPANYYRQTTLRTLRLLRGRDHVSLRYETLVRAPEVALHRTLLERQPRAKSERLRLDGLIARLQENGAGSLTREEKRDLLCDPTSMATLHALAWQGREEPPAGGDHPTSKGAAAH